MTTFKILCPTDFSEHSKRAIDFAFNISKTLNAELYLMTSFVEYRHTTSFKSVKNYIHERNEKELKQLIDSFQDVYKLTHPIHYAVLQGHTIEMISSYAHSNEIDLIIMGTQGSKSIQNRLWGSTTGKLIKQCKIPILAVPNIQLNGFGNGRFLMAIDNKAIYQNDAFHIITTLCKKLNKQVDIFHVKKDPSTEQSPFDPFISEYLSGHIAEFIIEEGHNPVKHIQEYIEQHPVELLIMIRHEHHLLNRLLYSSNTDIELGQANIPILIIPE